MYRKRVVPLIGVACLIAGCQDKAIEPVGPAKVSFAQGTPTDPSCFNPGQQITFGQSGANTKRLSPGESTTLRPMLYQGPGILAGDNACVRDLQIIPQGDATDGDYVLSQAEDGAVSFALKESAAPGGSFILKARYGKEQAIQDFITVYDTDRFPLQGIWSQDRSQCGRRAIGELEISKARFSVTWQPFETYKDYWGTYDFEPAEEGASAGRLSLRIEGGNYIPDGAESLTLEVSVDGDTLVVSEGSFGGEGYGARTCEAPFTRRR